MAEKKPRDSLDNRYRFIVIIAVAFTAIVFSIQVTDLQNQVRGLQEARLVNVSLGYSDNGKGIIHVSGYVYNSGTNTAYGCNVKVTQDRQGVITNSSTVFFGNNSSESYFGATVSGGASVYVDVNVTYTGAPPTNVTLKLGWIEPWQIPVP